MSFWAANVLGSVPINTLRYNWAYDNNSSIDSGLICLIFLLLVAVYLRLHTDEDEKIFSKKSKTTIVLLGLAVLTIYSGFSQNASCPYLLKDVLSELPGVVVIVFIVVAMLLASIYLYIIDTQAVSFYKNRVMKNNIL